jgi:hemolysin-activating ACP:hemolysin acyltransferase
VKDSIFTSLSNSNFPFGIEILSPHEVFFFTCFSDDKQLDIHSERIIPSINNGQFKLKLDRKNKSVKWKILSTSGSVIEEGLEQQCSEISFDVLFPNGIYFLQFVLEDGKTNTEKFVIEN